MDEEKNYIKMTPLDEALAAGGMQIVKGMLSYLPLKEQKMAAIYIKFMEFLNTVAYFKEEPKDLSACTASIDMTTLPEILKKVRVYGTKEDCAMIDQIIQLLDTMEMLKTYTSMFEGMASSGESGGAGDPMSMLMSMLPPEQQAMFEAYSEMF